MPLNSYEEPGEAMKDFEITLKVKNARLRKKIKGLGYSTVKAFCSDMCLSYVGVCNCLSLKTTVYDKNFKIRSLVEELSQVFNCPPTELFPESVWYEAMQTTTATVEMTEEEVLAALPYLARGDIQMIENEIMLDKVIGTLKTAGIKKKEQDVILLRLEGLTLKEAGKKMGVGQERARQLEMSAHRKLRHPSRGLTGPCPACKSDSAISLCAGYYRCGSCGEEFSVNGQ